MESRQKEIFENIHEEYYASTSDQYGQAYKEQYVFQRVRNYLGGAKTLIEIACGKGEAAGWLRERQPNLEISGCGISAPAVAHFNEINHRRWFVADLPNTLYHSGQYDALMVIGGMH